jgi:hypothetical protein
MGIPSWIVEEIMTRLANDDAIGASRRWARRLAGAAVCILAAVPVGAAEPSSSGLLAGEQVELQERPYWTVTGTWSPDGEELLLVDALRGEILRYDSQGRYQGMVPWEDKSANRYRPKAIFAHGGSYLLEYATGRFAELNTGFAKIREIEVLPRARNESGEVIAIFQWVPVADHLLAFVDLKGTDGEPVSAIVRIPLEDPAAFAVIETMAVSDPRRQMFLLGLPWLSAGQDRGFYLVPQEHPTVASVGAAEAVERRPVPSSDSALAGFTELPRLPADRGPKNAAKLFASLETARFASGLVAADGAVFVLLRQPGAAPPESSWLLRRIDPGSGAVSDLPLATRAPHLTIVPGPRQWALVEKGQVQGPGDQRVLGLTLIATAEVARSL